MGLMDRAKAAVRDAQDQVTESARAAEDRVAAKVGERRYAAVRSGTGKAAGATARGAGAAGAAGLRGIGGTRAGQKMGQGARTVATEVAGLPVLGLGSEILAARNGVPELIARVQRDPRDPEACLWLAEALRRTERDSRVALAVRTLTSPAAPLVRAASTIATKCGSEPVDPMPRRLLRRAFALASARIAADPADAPALHVAARVYLAQGMDSDAARLAALAAAADPQSGTALVTAARARLRQGRTDEARALAEQALAKRCTVAHEITAELLRRDLRAAGEATVGQRGAAYARELDLVNRQDRRDYYGAAPGVPKAGWAVAVTEAKKTATLARRVAQRVKGSDA